jgi:hypothetical protein
MRDFEKARIKDEAILTGIVRAFCSGSPALLKAYQHELKIAEDRLAKSPSAGLDQIYDGLIALLKNPAHPESDEQEKLRRLLESFEGPKQ